MAKIVSFSGADASASAGPAPIAHGAAAATDGPPSIFVRLDLFLPPPPPHEAGAPPLRRVQVDLAVRPEGASVSLPPLTSFAATRQNSWSEKLGCEGVGHAAAHPGFPEAGSRMAPSADFRKRLGLVSQRIKPKLGNVARRGLRYGTIVGCVLSTVAMMTAPILSPFFLIPAVAVAAAVPVLLVLGMLAGAIVESLARRAHIHRVAVADVQELENIYTLLRARKQNEGKLSGDDNQAWHKVNALLEEMSGGFWRGVRVLFSQQFGMKMRCGRYQVGSIFPETAVP